MIPNHSGLLASRCIQLRAEISRISNTTLRGDFKLPEDRQYWVDRSKRLNIELSAIEEMLRPKRGQKA